MRTVSRVARLQIVRVLGVLSVIAFLLRGGPSRPLLEAQADPNPIVTENSLAGSPQSEWDIRGAGDPTLQGFATDISVNKGSTVSFKIKTSAPGYIIEIYRLGYYQGFGARKIATVTPTAAQITAAQTQPGCMTDPASGLVDCGNWSIAGSWNTTGVTSGLFIAKLTRSDNANASSHIYFIVRDDARAADILFQTSDTTWQAYNRYGGNSLYCGGPLDSSAGRYNCPTRAGKVSYNRPFDTRVLDPQSFLFNAEYPMLRWLEANGYDVKYWTGVDTDRFGADPSIGLTSSKRPKAFFSIGHDEYWSAQQRAHVESARNAGVNLAFFSGNEMFWKTRFEPAIDGSNASYRTLVSYKETFGNGSRVDPDRTQPWTGTWRDPRFPQAGGGNPENALIGQLWMVNCCSDRIHVPPSFANLRFWRNTAVATLQPGDTGYRTSVETLGYEWDEVIDNGTLPSGLVRMSTTTLVVPERVTDFGINIAQGTATHSLTIYRHNSGALVFGAGTVQWAWGLDAAHDRSQVPADAAMQQATVNLLADMGAQPRTLQAGADPNRPLIAASMSNDIFAPTSTIVSPAPGSTVESGSRVAISGTASENGGGVVAGVEVSVDGGSTWRSANLLPSGVWNFEWTPGSPGTATIRSRAFDDSGNIETPGVGTTVTVGVGTCPCTSLWRPTSTPVVPSAADNNAVELGTKFYSDVDGFITGVRFYKSTANNGTHIGNLWSLGGTRLATVTFGNETPSGWQQAMFASPVPISANTTYIISYHTNVGSYAADGGYFANAPIDSPPLHAPSSPVAGGNGVFAYGPTQFPTGTFNATNYWVDVVFASTVSDTTLPVISRIKARTLDSSRVTISWNTDEEATSKIVYSTDPAILSDPTVLPPGTQTVMQGAFVTQHSILLTGLASNTTYYYRVISADRAGNAANIAAPSVTVPGPTLRDTASADFAAGTSNGTYVAETADGEVTLAPVIGSEFSGSTLSPGWIDVPYASGGAAFLGNGAVLVDGSRLGTCGDVNGTCQEQWSFTPGHRLEFMAVFTGDAFQHSGFAQDFASAAQPWAIFSTMGGGVLTARTNTGAGSIDTFLGTGFLGFPHKYTIDWTDSSVGYSIDGAVVATHNVVVPGPMRPIAASDFSVFGGNVVIDWMRLAPYAVSGSFESRVFDAVTNVDWRSMQWTANTPAGTAITMRVRTGSSPDPSDGTWSAWQQVDAPGPLALNSRYIQYGAILSTADPNVTPDLDDVIVSTGRAPTAANDSVVVPENGTMTFPAAGPSSLIANDTDPDNDPLEVVAVGPAAHGTTLVNFDGSVRYTPATNYSGPDSFVYTVSDGLLTSSAVVSIDVRFGNIPPVANNDFYTIDEERTLVVPAATGILKNDTDADHDALTAVLVTLPAHGMLALNSIGSFSYTPNPNYAGPDVFTYRASDGQATSDPATVQIQVLQVNDAPIAESDAYTAVINDVLDVSAPGVLANDHDVEVEDTAPLSAQIVSGPANGAVTLNSNGSFHYVPNPDFLGLDQFTYAAVDHFGAVGNPATVSITVVLKAVAQAVNGGGTVSTGINVTPGDPLVSTVTSPTAATVRIAQGVISGSQPPTGYTFLNQQVNIVVLNPDGTELAASAANPIRLAFTIDSSLLLPGENGNTIQIFRNGVLIPNCLGQTAIPAANLDPCVTAREDGPALNNDVRITVISSHASKWNLGLSSDAIGNAPVAQNDGVYEVNFQTPLVVPAAGVLSNDYGRTSITAVLVPGSEVGGTVDLSPSGGFTFTPGPTACGAASFRYRATDGTLNSNEATASIVIDCQPRAGSDTVTVAEDSGTTTITVLANDTDPDPGQALTVSSVGTPSHGVASVISGMAVAYAPEANFSGTDSFTYTVTDGRGGSDTGTVTVTVVEVNDAPSFTKGGNQSVNEDAGAQTVAGWATAMSAGPANESGQALDFIVTSDNASLFAAAPSIAPNGTLTYTTAPNANGLATVTARIHDSGGVLNAGADTSAPQTFTITVAAVNDAPSFVAGANQTASEDGGARTIPNWATAISAGAADEAGQALNFIVSSDNTSLFSSQPAIAADGTLTFTPVSDANGAATVTVRLHDNGGTLNGGADTSAPQTFTITVGAVNDPPSFVKGPDQTVVEDSGPRVVASWATGFSAGPANEAAQQILGYRVVSNSNAALFSAAPAIASDGTLTFTPAANASGTAVLSIVVQDDGGVANGGLDTSVPQSFSITVQAVNDAPSFTRGADVSVLEDAAPQTIANWATALSAGAENESAQALSFTITANSNPTLFAAAPAVSASGTLTFTPAPNAYGSASITLLLSDDGGTANDGSDKSAPQTFTIAVGAVNDAPSFAKGAEQVLYGNPGAQTVANWATGISAGPNEAAQALTFAVTSNNTALFAAQPAVSATGTLTYTPATDVVGTAVVTVVLKDDGGVANGGSDTSAAQTFQITVNKSPTVTSLATSNTPSLRGVPITLKATVAGTAPNVGVPGGTVTFKDGTTVLGTATLAGGVASLTTSTLAIGTHPLTAVYNPAGNFAGSTSATLSQVITASATLKVNFTVHAILDGTSKPKVQDSAVPGADVRVYLKSDQCTNGIIVSGRSKMWGVIYDGLDGVGGTDQGCTPFSYGSYQAVGVTDTAGNVDIIVPPTTGDPNSDYVIIARTTKFDYIKTTLTPDPLYSEKTIPTLTSGAVKDVRLHQIATFNGKLMPGKDLEEYGSYLGIVQPDFVDWLDDKEQYPVVLVAEGDWGVTTSLTPPEGFVAEEGTLSTQVADTTGAIQFTVNDIGSDWTATTLNHTITHLGTTRFRSDVIPMFNRKLSKAFGDTAKMMLGEPSVTIPVLNNDRMGTESQWLELNYFTQPNYGKVTMGADGMTLVYTPDPGWSGYTTFVYNLQDDRGIVSSADVWVYVLPQPTVSTKAAVSVTEGNAGSTPAVATILLSGESTHPVTVSYATIADTATAGADFTAASGTVTIDPGKLQATVPLTILGDTVGEPNEQFIFRLSSPANATLGDITDGVIKILDDDPPAIQPQDLAIAEGNVATKVVNVVVKLSQSDPATVSVNYATVDGTALAGSDYVAASGTLTFAPGSVSKSIPITIVGDAIGEPSEQFYVELSAPVVGILGQNRATVTITNDDTSTIGAATTEQLAQGSADAGIGYTETGDGEIALALAAGSEFSGSGLPARWSAAAVAAGGGAVVAGGSASVNGASLLGPAVSGAGRTFDAVATLTASNQAIGIGAGSLASPLAAFVVKADGLLYIRTVAPNASGVITTKETAVAGSWLGAPHTFHIDWNASNAAFKIDGTAVGTQTGTTWGTLAMGAMMLDSTAGDGGVTADWMRLTPYAASGTWSKVFDAGSSVAWQKLTSSVTIPVGSTLAVSYRTGDTPSPDASWTPLTSMASATGTVTGSGRYIEVRMQLSTTNANKTPVVNDLTLTYKMP